MSGLQQFPVGLQLGYPPISLGQDPTAPRPTFVRLMEVAFERRAKMLMFHYSRVAAFSLAGETIESLAARIATGSTPDPWKPGRGNRRRSSLSLHNRANTYLMFVLSDQVDWQFSREAPCFSLFGGSVDLTRYYLNPTCVDRSGKVIGEFAGHSDCRVGYFMARGDLANSEQGGTNVDRFNIHVDLNEDSGYYTPVMIDPDVGYPEGTEPSP